MEEGKEEEEDEDEDEERRRERERGEEGRGKGGRWFCVWSVQRSDYMTTYTLPFPLYSYMYRCVYAALSACTHV